MSAPRFESSDHIDNSSERGYSEAAAAALRSARSRLARSDISRDALESTYSALVELERQPMSQRQKAQACLFATRAASQLGEYDLALRWALRSLDRALPLEDTDALIAIHQELIAIYRATSRLSKASDECCLLVAHLHDRNQTEPHPNTRLEAHIVGQWAGFEYMRAHEELAIALLDQACALFRSLSASELDLAPLEWLRAHVDHGRGKLGAALEHAIAAASIYTTTDDTCSTSRIESLVADIALDLAEACANPAGQAYQRYLKLAGPSIYAAIKLAPLAEDPGGHGLARLQRARYDRLCGHADRAPVIIESVIHSARQHDDVALLAQAQTCLAQQFELRGEQESALNLYNQTLDLVTGSDFPALGFKAQRAILHASEMGINVFS